MPLPLIVIAGMVGTGLYGVVKGVKGAKDAIDAKDINGSAQSMVNSANRRVESQREQTNDVLAEYGERKLRSFDGPIRDFIATFGRLKNVEAVQTPELDKLQLGDFSTITLEGLKSDYELLKSSGLGVSAGLTSGAALAFGAYNGTMLLATASTGTAISTLSGVAATNATLAWLGGGSLAAGGMGMAGGMMVLGSVVAGPALAIFGHIVGNRGSAALADAYSNMQKAKTHRDSAQLVVDKLKAIQGVTALANGTFSHVVSLLRRAVRDLGKVLDAHGEDYLQLPAEGREVVFRAVKFAQLIKAMIDTPILDEDGNLVLSTEKRVRAVSAAADGKEIDLSEDGA